MLARPAKFSAFAEDEDQLLSPQLRTTINVILGLGAVGDVFFYGAILVGVYYVLRSVFA